MGNLDCRKFSSVDNSNQINQNVFINKDDYFNNFFNNIKKSNSGISSEFSVKSKEILTPQNNLFDDFKEANDDDDDKNFNANLNNNENVTNKTNDENNENINNENININKEKDSNNLNKNDKGNRIKKKNSIFLNFLKRNNPLEVIEENKNDVNNNNENINNENNNNENNNINLNENNNINLNENNNNNEIINNNNNNNENYNNNLNEKNNNNEIINNNNNNFNNNNNNNNINNNNNNNNNNINNNFNNNNNNFNNINTNNKDFNNINNNNNFNNNNYNNNYITNYNNNNNNNNNYNNQINNKINSANSNKQGIKSLRSSTKSLKKENWMLLNIQDFIPLELLLNKKESTILLQSEFLLTSKKNYYEKITPNIKYITLTHSEIKIYRSKEIFYRLKNPLVRLSLFNINKCNVFNKNNNKKYKLLNHSFFIEFQTLNFMERSVRNSNNRLFTNTNINIDHRKPKKIEIIKDNFNKTFELKKKIEDNNNNNNYYIFSSNDENKINQWIAIINYLFK